MPFLRVTEMAAMEPSFWSWEKGRSILVHGKGGHAAMEPSFWSWEKSPASAVSNTDSSRRNGAQLLELGKAELATYLAKLQSQAAMEPSFWSWEKAARGISRSRSRWAAMEPSFWSWEKGQPPHLTSKPCLRAAMEPSFWSWEKPTSSRGSSRGCAMPQWSPAFGAGKSYNVNAEVERVLLPQWSPAFGAGKSGSNSPLWSRKARPQWSPAFGAGKSRTPRSRPVVPAPAAMEPSFWSWEKSSRFFHQLTTSVAHLCEQRKFWGRRVGLLLPDRLGKLALTRARALPRGTEGAGALARRSAGLGWVAPRGLQRI